MRRVRLTRALHLIPHLQVFVRIRLNLHALLMHIVIGLAVVDTAIATGDHRSCMRAMQTLVQGFPTVAGIRLTNDIAS